MLFGAVPVGGAVPLAVLSLRGESIRGAVHGLVHLLHRRPLPAPARHLQPAAAYGLAQAAIYAAGLLVFVILFTDLVLPTRTT